MNAANRTARNLALISAASFAQVVIQFLITRVLAEIYGTEAESQAWAATLPIPTMFAAIITGSLGYVLVPELVSKFQRGTSHREGWQLASFIGLATTGLSLLIGLAIYLGAAEFIELLYAPKDALQAQTRTELLRILSVQVALNGIISWAQAVHHSRHQFMWPALGGVVGTGVTLVLALYFGQPGKINSIAWSVNVGSIVSVAIHMAPLLSQLELPRADMGNLGRLVRLYWPLLAGSAFIRVDPVIDRVLTDKYCDLQAIAQLGYARSILLAIVAIGASGLSVIVFPQLAERYAKQGSESFGEHFSLAVRRLVLLVVPITIGASCFAVWIVRDLLERGQFTAHDSQMVGWIIVVSMGMFVGASVGELFARAFYVLGDTKTPTFVGAGSLVLGILFKIALVQPLGIWGIAAGVSFYFLLSASIMGVLLYRLGCGNFLHNSRSGLVQAVASSALACGCCYLLYRFGLGGTWIAAPVGALVYLAALYALRNPDARQLTEELKTRWIRAA